MDKLQSTCIQVVKSNKGLFFTSSISALSFVFIMWLNSMYVLPPGTDPAQWLRWTYAFMGDITPYWRWDPLLYPPLPFVILAFILTIVKDGLLALKILGALSFSLIPITTYLITKILSQNERSAIAAAVLAAIFPAFFEMWGWGAYPNLLGLFFLGMAFFSLLRAIDDPCMKNAVAIIFFAFLTIYTHHMTAVIFIATTVFYVLATSVLMFTKKNKSQKEIRVLQLLIIVSFLTILFSMPVAISLWNNYSLFDNANSVKVELGTFQFMFKGLIVLGPLVFLTSISIIAMFRDNTLSVKLKSLLGLMWLVLPLLMTQAYIFGVRADFSRFLFFALQPLIILAATSPTHRTKFRFSIKDFKLKTDAVIAGFLMILLLVSGVLGVSSALGANRYFHFIVTGDSENFGDRDIYDAIMWLEENVPKNTTILSSSSLAPWIEALAHRKTLFSAQTKYLYIKGDIERTMDAEVMLMSSYELRNTYLQIREDAFHRNFNPLLRVHNNGEYHDLAYIGDSSVNMTVLVANGTKHTESLNLATVENVELIGGENYAELLMIYKAPTVIVEKVVRIHSGNSTIELAFHIKSPEDSPSRVSAFWFTITGSQPTSDITIGESQVSIRGHMADVEITLSNGNLTNIIAKKETTWFVRALYNLTHITNDLTVEATWNIHITQPISPTEPFIYSVSRYDLLKKYNVRYVALLHFDQILERFIDDPMFKLVYKNSKVFIFSVYEKA